jgi:DNA-binding transcriptional LysR family regulator
MDWPHLRFDWNRTRAFLAAAEEGTLSAAARVLGTTQPTVGRQVAALEEELGVTLFARVGGRLQLTDSGLELLEHARAMAEAAARVSLAAAGQSTALTGRVTLTASEAISAFWLPPVLAELRAEHPGITVDVLAANDLRDLHRREADLALRNVRPTRPDLVARRLRDATAGLYAAPSLVQRVGGLDQPADLARTELLAFDRGELMLQALVEAGAPVTMDHFPVVTANHLVQWAMVKAGVGVGFMMVDVGDAEPGVVRVVEGFELQVPTWLVCHRELRTSRRLRLVFDRLVAALG